MKTCLTLLSIIACLCLCGCPAQTQFYSTGYAQKKDGTKFPVPILTASIGQDLTGDVAYKDSTHSLTVSVAPEWAGKFYTVNKYDAKGNLVAIEQKPVLAGMSSSRVVKAWIGDKGAPGVLDSTGTLIGKGVGASVLPAVAAPFAALGR